MLSPELLAVTVVAVVMIMVAFCLAGSLADERITRLKADEARRLQELADAALEGICIHVDDRILDANQALARLLGLNVQALIGRPIWEFVPTESRASVLDHLASGSIERYEGEVLRSDGQRVPVEVYGRPIDYFGRCARVAAVHDLTQRKEAEARMRHMALHDALTNLPNRVLFVDRLQLALDGARRSGDGLAVISLDLDRFKEINDVYGHATGDLLLKEVAARLVSVTGGDVNTVARLGGDEFAIIQPTPQHPTAPGQLAQRLTAALSTPFDVDDKLLSTAVSIGIAMFPKDGASAATLLQFADVALYRAKAEGGGIHRLFEMKMEATVRERRAIEQDLRAALSEGRLELHYQPQANIKTGTIEGFEALARWHHPVRGPMAADQFIPIAEDTGLIFPLGEWALRRACRDAAQWPNGIGVGVNLSPVQFRQGDLPELIADVLEDTGLRPDRLELEITETVLIRDRKRASTLLSKIKALGVTIAMDDFGTGFSSLSHLRDFPFDKIKIDKSFIDQLHRPDTAAIVEAIIALGRKLGVAVVAEGVETAETGEFLRRHGCYLIQGYLIAKPMPNRRWHGLRRVTDRPSKVVTPFRRSQRERTGIGGLASAG
jgi:diguanylate cyclase (GGDEF)-like protein/PAS domain S-box-containing protein